MKKVDVFKRELSKIRDEDYRKAVEGIINQIPAEFFLKPASSTGKYHPPYAKGKHGLLLHTKCAFWIGYRFMEPGAMFERLSDHERDVALTALLIHDTMKYGRDGGKSKGGFTYFEHPTLVKSLVDDYLEGDSPSEKVRKFLADVLNCVESHMGSWSTNRQSKIILRVPETQLEKFVHLCDYAAGTPFLFFSNKTLELYLKEDKK